MWVSYREQPPHRPRMAGAIRKVVILSAAKDLRCQRFRLAHKPSTQTKAVILSAAKDCGAGDVGWPAILRPKTNLSF